MCRGLSSIAVPYAVPSLSGGEYRLEAGVQKGYQSVVTGGRGSAVNIDPGGEGSIIDGGNAIREARSMLGDRRRWGVRGIRSGCNTGTKVHAGISSGRKGGRCWPTMEVPIGGAMLLLISWIPLLGGEARVGRGVGGGGGQAASGSS